MKDFIEIINQHVQEQPNKIALVDTGVEFTYRQIDYISGKIYHYLKEKNIGKEDFVAICLPRGAQPIIAMLGVWKAGAAFIMLEEHYAPERTEFILKDCNAKLVIDNDLWAEMQSYSSMEGHEKVNEHDAALAIYTSGSTGNPKGVVHEFGNIDYIDRSNKFEGVNNISYDEIDGMITPLTFIAGAGACIMALMAGCTLHVIPYSIVKNPDELAKYIYENKITKMSLSPTLYRAFKEFSPYLKKIFMGGEPISGIYNDKIDIISAYSMSECGALIAAFRIDKVYDRTPIGKPQFDLKYWIVDEDGHEVEDGESGELCVEVPYVRGYMNLPELTEKVFKDKIYHTGDIVKKLPDGNLMILGRSNDMIKINGNRVEPGEVEAAVKKALNIDWACVKGFEEGKSAFLCAYYTADIEIDYEKVRNALLEYVPYYMVPSYFVKLDQVPTNANGKVDKKSLKAPSIDECRGEYVAPTNEIEEKLCHAFEKALEIGHIGIQDDFYLLGGDSLASMKVVAESGIKGLSINEVFRGRTPQKIAELLNENQLLNNDEDESEEERIEKMRLPHNLTAEQIVMVDHQLYAPKSDMYNLSGLLKFGKGIDAQKLADAVNLAISVHPSLNTVFNFNIDGEIVQCYKPELATPVQVEKISEEELNKIKDTLIQPFKIMNSCLYRGCVYQTENDVYLFIDIHHTVFDGTSFQILMGDIDKAYKGLLEDKKDYYYEILRERESFIGTPFYQESQKYFEDNYFSNDFDVAPKHDKHTNEKVLGECYNEMPLLASKLDAIEDAMKISRNEFFIASTILAIAKYNQSSRIKVNWIFNGRQKVNELSTTGLLLRSLPVAENIQDNYKLVDLLQSVHNQVSKGLEHSCYPYSTIFKECLLDDETSVLYQNSLKGVAQLCDVQIENIELERPQPAYENIIDIEIMDHDDHFDVLLEYATCFYEKESMDKFSQYVFELSEKLTDVIDHPQLTVKDIM